MYTIQIADVAIRQVSNDLFNLNDLHKAAGGESKHEPYRFLRNAQTQAMIEAILENGGEPVQTVNGGSKRGTYVCKELVIAYGMWIDAQFALKVIRTFDAARTQGAGGMEKRFVVHKEEVLPKVAQAKALSDEEVLALAQLYDCVRDAAGLLTDLSYKLKMMNMYQKSHQVARLHHHAISWGIQCKPVFKKLLEQMDDQNLRQHAAKCWLM